MPPPPPPPIITSPGTPSSSAPSSRLAYDYADVPSGPRNPSIHPAQDGSRMAPVRSSGRPSRFDSATHSGPTAHDNRDAMDIDHPPFSRQSSARGDDARWNGGSSRPSPNGLPAGTPRAPKAMAGGRDDVPLDSIPSPSTPHQPTRPLPTTNSEVANIRNSRPLPPHMVQDNGWTRRDSDALPSRLGSAPDGPRRVDERDRIPETRRPDLSPRVRGCEVYPGFRAHLFCRTRALLPVAEIVIVQRFPLREGWYLGLIACLLVFAAHHLVVLRSTHGILTRRSTLIVLCLTKMFGLDLTQDTTDSLIQL